MGPTLFNILKNEMSWYEKFWAPQGKKPTDLVKQGQFRATKIPKGLEDIS